MGKFDEVVHEAEQPGLLQPPCSRRSAWAYLLMLGASCARSRRKVRRGKKGWSSKVPDGQRKRTTKNRMEEGFLSTLTKTGLISSNHM